MDKNVKYKKDNIFTSKHQTLVNTVNCVGVMGAGIALEFKYRYQEMFQKYVDLCKQKLIEIGKLWLYDSPSANKKVLNFPTKRDWKHPSKYEYLEKGLKRFVDTYKEKGITSVAFPLLGAQNGGLDPEKVIALMFSYLEHCDIPVEIYEYNPVAKDDLIDTFYSAFTRHNSKELEKITGLKKNVVDKLKTVLENNELNSLIQLTKIKGLGEEVIKSCFQFALNYKPQPVAYPQEIFPTSEVHEDSVNAEKKPVVTKTSRPKKNIKKKGELVMGEKILLTGLDEKTILSIESNSENVTIGDLKTYCTQLKINFKNHFIKNFISPSASKRNRLSKGLTESK